VSAEAAWRPGPPPGQAIQTAIEANMCTYWLSLAQGPAAERWDGSDLKWAYTGSPVLNRVAGAQLDEDQTDARIAEVLQRFRGWGAGVTWLTGPSTRPPDLGQRLLRQGFSHQDTWTGMALDLSAAATPDSGPPGLTVGPADGGAARRVWLDVVGTAFRLPPAARGVFGRLPSRAGATEGPDGALWRRYLGFLDGRPVSAAALVGAAGAAGVYLVGTVPGARQRGFATALTHHVLAEARALGYDLAVLQATNEGRGLYRKLGFVEYGVIEVYRWTPPQRWGPRRFLRLVRSGCPGLRWPARPQWPQWPLGQGRG
jgi:ribosomal protein S18 acetylase RimI-like enzyme